MTDKTVGDKIKELVYSLPSNFINTKLSFSTNKKKVETINKTKQKRINYYVNMAWLGFILTNKDHNLQYDENGNCIISYMDSNVKKEIKVKNNFSIEEDILYFDNNTRLNFIKESIPSMIYTILKNELENNKTFKKTFSDFSLLQFGTKDSKYVDKMENYFIKDVSKLFNPNNTNKDIKNISNYLINKYPFLKDAKFFFTHIINDVNNQTTDAISEEIRRIVPFFMDYGNRIFENNMLNRKKTNYHENQKTMIKEKPIFLVRGAKGSEEYFNLSCNFDNLSQRELIVKNYNTENTIYSFNEFSLPRTKGKKIRGVSKNLPIKPAGASVYGPGIYCSDDLKTAIDYSKLEESGTSFPIINIFTTPFSIYKTEGIYTLSSTLNSTHCANIIKNEDGTLKLLSNPNSPIDIKVLNKECETYTNNTIDNLENIEPLPDGENTYNTCQDFNQKFVIKEKPIQPENKKTAPYKAPNTSKIKVLQNNKKLCSKLGEAIQDNGFMIVKPYRVKSK